MDKPAKGFIKRFPAKSEQPARKRLGGDGHLLPHGRLLGDDLQPGAALPGQRAQLPARP